MKKKLSLAVLTAIACALSGCACSKSDSAPKSGNGQMKHDDSDDSDSGSDADDNDDTEDTRNSSLKIQPVKAKSS